MLLNKKRIVIDEPESDISKKYLNIAERVKYYGLNHNKKAIIMLSGNAKDGKSTVATNLAIALAKKGEKVVFLDADLENPSIHDTFNIKLRNGISDAIMADKNILNMVYDTNVYGLSIILAGLKRDIGNELFLSNKFKYILRTLKNQYDAILVDAGMSANEDANLNALSEIVDTAIIIKNKDNTDDDTLETLIETVEQQHIDIIGIVENFDEQ